MTKQLHNDVFDQALNYILNNCDKITICSQPPTTYAEGNVTYALADVAVDTGDFTVGDGDTNGRKVAVAAQNSVPVDTSGIGTHLALLDTINSKLLGVTEEGTVVRSNTAQAGGASTITLDAGASASDDQYNGWAIKITGGTGAGQTRMISDYVGSTKVATVASAWTTQPDNTSTFTIFGQQLVGGANVNFPTFDLEMADPV